MKITLQPGEDRSLSQTGYGVYIIAADGPVLVELREIDGRVDQAATLAQGKGLGWEGGTHFEGIRVINLHDQAQDVTFYVGPRRFIDNTGSVNVVGDVSMARSETLEPGPMITTDAVAVDTIAAKPGRKNILMAAAETNAGVFWLGGVANEGLPVGAGAVLSLDTVAAVELLGTNSGDILYYLEQS